MQVAPLPTHEAERLHSLAALEILDTPNDARFDRVTRLAAQIFAVPMVAVSLVDKDRQWFKSCVGLSVTETPRDVAFCAHAILSDEVLVVEDALLDPRFSDNPLVIASPNIRFYAGRPLRADDGACVGTLCIMDRTSRKFSDEERMILDDLAQIVEVQMVAIKLERLAALAQRRVERLNAFNVFLNHTNAAIGRMESSEEILAAVCEVAVQDGEFLLAWAGVLSKEGDRVIPLAVFGDAVDYVAGLAITTDPALETSKGPTRRCMVERRVIVSNDFDGDAATAPWHILGEKYGIRSSAAVPVIADGDVLATLTFYSGYKDHFDAELIVLLEEAARTVCLALQATRSLREKEVAEIARKASETRFSRAFNASPVPMQIVSCANGLIRFVNKAHEQSFGYRHDEMPDEKAWFRLAFPDPAESARHLSQWREVVLPHAIASGPAHVSISPEMTISCKDGSHRICRTYTSVSGDDIVVQFLDLTEIKRGAAELVERERSFRRMVEQSPLGIYVVQGGRIVYANPRFSEIIGWPASDILGRDSCDLLHYDPGLAVRVRGSRERLLQGEDRVVTFDVAARGRDGRALDLVTHGVLVAWDGEAAIVVMVEDVTERNRAQRQIAAYVAELEGTVGTTLEAVATMVEMRDPYTAGHENRVSIIAADIAREMGWSEERCHSLQLAGLVHDIGKIAIPAEILTKPSRLTPLEYEMIKTHAERGYEILKNVKGPVPIAQIIRGHHERMDGSGYPHGLKGDEILPETRVLAVADVLESMASHRPYRPALGLEAGLEELQSHRGIWFDEDVVDAVMRLVRDKGYTLPS